MNFHWGLLGLMQVLKLDDCTLGHSLDAAGLPSRSGGYFRHSSDFGYPGLLRDWYAEQALRRWSSL